MKAPRGRRSWLVTVAVASMTIGSAEVMARLLEPLLPDPILAPTIESQIKLTQMESMSTNGETAVVVIGSSVLEAGLDPALIEARIGLGPVYNAALPFSTPLAMEVWARDFVIPFLHPDVVVIGVTPWPAQSTDQTDPLRYGLLQLNAISWRHRVATALESRSALFRLRSLPAEWDEAKARQLTIDLSFWTERGHQTGYYEGRISGQILPGDVSDQPLLSADNERALERLLVWLRSQSVQTVVVIEPARCDVIEAACDADARLGQDLERLRVTVENHGAGLIDMQAVTWSSELFSDLIHPNRQGTIEFSQFFARRLTAVLDTSD